MSELPIRVAEACTLPTAERPTRSAEWGSLFREVLATESLGAQRGRLVFHEDAALETRVRDLASKETSCCSFFTFEFGAGVDAAGAGTMTLDVRVPPSQSAVLEAFIAWAEGVRTGRLQVA
ncbi:MAG TPA: hypothetical protein VFY88_01095 [Intrasporangium sp.]|nr:hypothetical protein [Intrasporangium sp.]